MKSSGFFYFFLAVIMAALLYLAFRGVDIGASMRAVKSAQVLPLLLGVAIMFLSHGVRALRWQIVLRPLKHRTNSWLAFKSTIAGYAMNNLIPRSGEVVRPYMMARGERIPMAGTLASVVVERLTDVLALAALIVFSLLTYKDRVTSVFPMFSKESISILAIMLVALAGFILFFFSERRAGQILSFVARPFPARISEKISRMGNDFSRGLRGIDRKAIAPLAIGTIGIWASYGLSMYVSLRAFNAPAMNALTIGDAFLLLTLSGIAFTIPTPGAVGSYDFLISLALFQIFHVPHAIAIAYAIATHTLSYVATTVVGIVFLVRGGISFRSARALNSENDSASAPPPSSFTAHPSPDLG